jgi:excisionase family DNA binding protein
VKTEVVKETGDQLMTIKQMAQYLSLNERTVLKLVTEGTLPAVKIGNQWRLRKAMIDTLLDDQMLGLTPRIFGEQPIVAPSPALLTLSNCLELTHIIPKLQATKKTAVVEELAGLAHQLGLVRDKTWFMGALIERENIMPSAMGNGVAFLHTVRRNPQQVVRPFMVFGRSQEGVDFDAIDGKPTHLFFVLGLKYEVLHLPWLSKLSQMVAVPDTLRLLLAADDAQSIFDALKVSERGLG